MKIYVIVKISTRTCGHGDSMKYYELAMQGQYNSLPPYPAFQIRQAAVDFYNLIDKYKELKILEMELQ